MKQNIHHHLISYTYTQNLENYVTPCKTVPEVLLVAMLVSYVLL